MRLLESMLKIINKVVNFYYKIVLVMVFVHSRKDTLATAEFFIDKAKTYNELDIFVELFDYFI